MHGQLMIGLAISMLNIAVHATIMTSVTWSAHRMSILTRSTHARLRVAAIMIAAVSVLMLAHYVEVAVWALFYRALDVAPKDGDAFYFAFVNYTTLGYGDIVPIEYWRLLGPITAMNGVLLFGWSTAVIYDVLRSIARAIPIEAGRRGEDT
jgi:hypothetical protein